MIKLFFFNKRMKNITWTNLTDLKKYRVGGVQDYGSTKILLNAGLELEMVHLEKLGFKMLYADRIDLFPSVDLVGWGIIGDLFPDQKKYFGAVEKNISKKAFAVMFSRKHPDSPKMLQVFNEGLKRIKEKGIYKQVLKKYGIENQ